MNQSNATYLIIYYYFLHIVIILHYLILFIKENGIKFKKNLWFQLLKCEYFLVIKYPDWYCGNFFYYTFFFGR